jgi:hypothetical protein
MKKSAIYSQVSDDVKTLFNEVNNFLNISNSYTKSNIKHLVFLYYVFYVSLISYELELI